jgi:hypothetical protein
MSLGSIAFVQVRLQFVDDVVVVLYVSQNDAVDWLYSVLRVDRAGDNDDELGDNRDSVCHVEHCPG